MADQRDGGISWCEETWNPVRGCSRVSVGCERCYAEEVARRFSGPGQPYEGLVRLDGSGKSKAQWNGKVRFVDEHLFDPLRWKRPRRIFVNSMSDLFHEALSEAQIAQIFGVMGLAERHTFQVLTKRAKRMQVMLSKPSFWTRVGGFCEAYAEQVERQSQGAMMGFDAWWNGVEERKAFRNVWLGVSVENQEAADERIPVLLNTPASVRWVSYEPALGPVDFSTWMPTWRCPKGHRPESWNGGPSGETVCGNCGAPKYDGPGLSWIVVGGESGTGARPFDLAWARSTLAACKAASVPCFIKQLGAKVMRSRCRDCADVGPVCPNDGLPCAGLKDRKGGKMEEWPVDLKIREFPR